jgi:hypothetical protein
MPVIRKEVGWDKNVPIPVMLQPGDIFVREINMEDKTWNWPSLADFCKKNPHASISVRLQIQGNAETKQNAVWVGSVQSGENCQLEGSP